MFFALCLNAACLYNGIGKNKLMPQLLKRRSILRTKITITPLSQLHTANKVALVINAPKVAAYHLSYV